MNETNFGKERNPIEELSQGDAERLQQSVDGYIQEHPGFVEVTDKEIDDILSRYIEEGQELEPNVKDSLKRAVRSMLGIPVEEKSPENNN